MAAGNFMKEFCDEVTCSICLEYFRDPVMIECGHNFCRACLTRCWGESKAAASCPQCRENIQQRDFKPNRQLANLLGIAKRFQEEKRAGDKSGVCKEHQEPLKLFCRDDLVSICVVCDRSKKHQNHSVLPVEEAFQEYKAQLEEERKKSVSVFEEMQQFLEEEKSSWLAHLGDLETKFKARQKGNIARLSKEIASLSELIAELERKCQQPVREFLQDLKSTLKRYEAMQGNELAQLPSELEKPFQMCAEKNSSLEVSVKSCKESLDHALHNVNITLDPDTAHPCLYLSCNQMSVTKENGWQKLPDKAERFDKEMCVLGCEKFSSGRHRWVVELEGSGHWAVGVAREAVQRKGEIGFNPNEGIWALEFLISSSYYSSWEVSALTSPKKKILCHMKLKKILVSLDMGKNHVAFSDAEKGIQIFTFLLDSLSGERISPFFYVSSGRLSLNEKPQPLRW